MMTAQLIEIPKLVINTGAVARGNVTSKSDLHVCRSRLHGTDVSLPTVAFTDNLHPRTSVTRMVETEPPLMTRRDVVCKRCLDIVVAVPVVLLVLPVLCLLVKVLQWFQSPGSLFYRQQRCGRFGVRFTVLKFRTMHPVPPGQSDLDGDVGARVFAAGRFLRASRLDEIPQFWNVLWGTMSIVGPRPHHGQDRRAFTQVAAAYPLRLLVKPGITGLAQYEEYEGVFRANCVVSRLQRDLEYIRHWSPLLDVVVMIKTGRVIVEALMSVFRNASTRRGVNRAPTEITRTVNDAYDLPLLNAAPTESTLGRV